MIDETKSPFKLDAFEKELSVSFLNDNFHLILLPTEQCNFRCTYCYEDFTIGRMSSEIIQGVKRFIERRLDGLRFLSVSWFGGEPLLARDIIEDISEHIVALVDGQPNIKYSGEMTTNGYHLDLTMLAQLKSLGICYYQISLDGPKQFHDQTRLRANGKGSFDRIWGNLTAIRQSSIDVDILLRVHLTPSNLPYMPEFLACIRDRFLDDSRFSVLLKPIERLGGPNNDKIGLIATNERPRILQELKAIVCDSGGSGRLYEEPKVCYAARPNSLMIRANGVVGKCTVALADPANNIGRVLPDGSLQLDNAKVRPWLRGWQSRDWNALSCPYDDLPGNRGELITLSKLD